MEKPLNVIGLTEDLSDSPEAGIQYSFIDSSGERHILGDQQWARDGGPLLGAHPSCRIESRTVTIKYSSWTTRRIPEPPPGFYLWEDELLRHSGPPINRWTMVGSNATYTWQRLLTEFQDSDPTTMQRLEPR